MLELVAALTNAAALAGQQPVPRALRGQIGALIQPWPQIEGVVDALLAEKRLRCLAGVASPIANRCESTPGSGGWQCQRAVYEFRLNAFKESCHGLDCHIRYRAGPDHFGSRAPRRLVAGSDASAR